MSRTPLRVLHAHSGNVFGGVETVLVTLARHAGLSPGIQWRFALTTPGRLSSELTDLGLAPVVVGAVRASRPWSVWAARAQLRRHLERQPADLMVVHSLWSLAVFGPVARQCGHRIVLAVHGPATGPAWLVQWARRSPPDFLLLNSRHTAAHLPAWLVGTPSATQYYPVDPTTSATVADPAPPTSPGVAAVFIAGRMEAWKGHLLLLEALERLRTRTDWTCWVAGGVQQSSERAYLRTLVGRVNQFGLAQRVTFLGQRQDVRALMQRAAIYCQPNTGPEPFGIVFIEALYAGLPVVTTAIGAAPEIVTADCGVLVPAGNAAALAATLVDLLDDPQRRASLAQAGPSRARTLCDPARCMPQLAVLLAEAARVR